MRFVTGLVIGAAVGVAAARFRRPRPIIAPPPRSVAASTSAPAGGRVIVDVSEAPAEQV